MSSFDDPRAPKPPSTEDMHGVLDLARKFQEEESALRVNVRGYSQEADEPWAWGCLAWRGTEPTA